VNATTYYGDGGNLTGISTGQWTDGGTYIYANNATNVVVTDAGSVGIGTSTPWGKLSVTNTGTGPSFIVEDSTSPDSTPFIVDASGKVGIGITTPNNLLQVKDLINFDNTDANTKLGDHAGANIVSGAQYNTFVGYYAGYASLTGSTSAADKNTAVGYRSLYSNTAGTYNTAIGDYALDYNTTGVQNTAIGSFSLYPNDTGSYNTAIGHSSLYNNQYGSNNVALGTYAGYYANATSTGNVFIGKSAGPSAPAQVSNRLYINNAGGTPLIYGEFDTGRVGIGMTAPGQKLSVAGTIESTTGGFKFPDATLQTTAASSPTDWTCEWIWSDCTSLTGINSATAYCTTGYKIISGGCGTYWDDACTQDSYPTSNLHTNWKITTANSFQCRFSTGVTPQYGKAQAYCCK